MSVRRGLEEAGTTARKNAFLYSRSGGVQRIHHAVLLLADFDLASAADLDDCDAA